MELVLCNSTKRIGIPKVTVRVNNVGPLIRNQVLTNLKATCTKHVEKVGRKEVGVKPYPNLPQNTRGVKPIARES
jgi:hypothetical protein